MSDSLNEAQVRLVYRAVLKREPENDGVISAICASGLTLEGLIQHAISSPEFSAKFRPTDPDHPRAPGYEAHNDRNFLSPRDLRVDARLPPRVLLIGSCFLDWWGDVVEEAGFDVATDRLHIDMHPTVPPPHPWDAYRYQIGQAPLRSIFPDNAYLNFLLHGYSDVSLAERAFKSACKAMESIVRRCCCWSDKTPIFMLNFLSPMQSVNGRLFGKFDLRDTRFFIRELNHELERIVATIPNAYVLDADEVAATMGRRLLQDDAITILSHGGLAVDLDPSWDDGRLVAQPPLSSHYRFEVRDYIAAMFSEAEAAFRSLRGIGAVKMVCVDLDDTLWRGVLAEADYIDIDSAVEGWPIGIIEALATLKRRGILLCVISKNDEDTVRRIWSRLYGGRFSLEEFAIKKINWRSKSENIADAMREANLLPGGVVFMDDNPAERHAVATAFPELRVITASHFYWKRILLWSAETQTAAITDESGRRTEMVKAQVEREAARSNVSREEFLRDLRLQVEFTKIAGRGDSHFSRVLELVNKTNQFNTTGRRWTTDEIDHAAREGMVLAVDVRDRFTNYGLVAVAIWLDGTVELVVMSCRVIGLDIELALLSKITQMALRRRPVVVARTEETKSNLLSRDLFQRGGWKCGNGQWRADAPTPMPAHIDTCLPSNIT